jgi:TRAP-type C4-dicarboxylate transport system permease small subunit
VIDEVLISVLVGLVARVIARVVAQVVTRLALAGSIAWVVEKEVFIVVAGGGGFVSRGSGRFIQY